MIHLDSEQRAAVTAGDHAVVSAGAGSGKTRVLVERYIRLVKDEGAGIEEVLAVTFTRKAATEMRERIFLRLQDHRGDTHVREQLANFESAQIQTFDSLCGEILRSSAPVLGLTPDFVVDDEAAIEAAYPQTARFVLQHLQLPALGRLVAAFGFARVTRELFLQRMRDSFYLGREIDLPAMHEEQTRKLEAGIAEAAARIGELLEQLVRISLPSNLKAAGDRSLLESLADRSWPALAHQELLDAAVQVKALRAPGGGAKAPEAAEYRELINALKPHLKQIEEFAATLALSGEIEALFGLLQEYQVQALSWKRAGAVVGYADVVSGAMRVLDEVPDVLNAYRRRLRHILVDEFQDNNQTQKELIYRLAGLDGDAGQTGPRLFLVGDDKQSIYRFRGADVSLFHQVTQELRDRGGEAVVLPVNYRSAPSLVRFYNRLFPRVFGGPGEGFGEIQAFREDTGPAPVRLLLHDGDDFDAADSPEAEFLDPTESEAYHVARMIRRLVDEGSYRFNDIAVLMRSTSNQNAFERMFRHFDLPYQSRSLRGLFSEAIVSDFYYLLRLVLYPEDRVAYAAVLRSPLVGLSDDGFVRVLRKEEEPFAPVELADDDSTRYAAGSTLYADLGQMAKSATPEELLETIWYRKGYRYHYARSSRGRSYLEHFDFLLSFALLRPDEGLPAFLLRLKDHLGEYRRMTELHAPRSSVTGVQLMSIHQAKGLEFPVVVVVDAGNRGRHETPGGGPVYLSAGDGILINAAPEGVGKAHALGRTAARESAILGLEELRRLLYVACTRAEELLVVSGRTSSRNKLNENSLMGILVEALGHPGGPEWAADSRVVEDGDGLYTIERLGRVPRSFEERSRRAPVRFRPLLPDLSRRVRPRRSFSPREVTATAVSELYWEHKRTGGPGGTPETLPALDIDGLLGEAHLEPLFGEVVHRLLELGLRDRRLPEDPGDLEIPALGALESGETARRIFGAARGAIEGFFDVAPELSLDAADTEVQTEVPFFLKMPTRGEDRPLFARGKIDLVILRPDRVRILDFKTDRTLLPERHAAQIALYCLAAESIFSRPARGGLFYIRGRRFVEIDSQEVAAELSSTIL